MTYLYSPNRELNHRALVKLGSYVTGKVLDAGSSTASRYARHFQATEIVCMDVSEGAPVKGSIEDIPFPEHNFDSIVSTQVLEHVPNPEKAVSELSRVLKPGGYALITVPQCAPLHEEPHDYFRYTKYGLTAMFNRHGFEVVTYEQQGGLFFTISYLLTKYIKAKVQRRNPPKIVYRAVSFLFKVMTKIALFLDKLDTSADNTVHTLGWIFIFKKV